MIENAFAMVRGQPLTSLPNDLYIPPDALEIFLEAFAGPLDLLLYLIKKQNFDILDIPVAEVTRQYIAYIELMKEMRLELAAEYLVMAAMLAEIKSRLLLPRPPSIEGEEDDPRAELVRRLQEYEIIKQAALALDKLPQQGRDVFSVSAQVVAMPIEPEKKPKLDLQELMRAFQSVLRRAELVAHHQVQKESLSIRERMSHILTIIKPGQPTYFKELFSLKEGRMGVVVTFIAILELLKQSLIEMFQAEAYAEIHIQLISSSESSS